MATSLTVLGIRHHGPGSARVMVRALEALQPDAVLIEGPPDAADITALAGHPEMKPPVAILVYEPDDPKESVYYPFAEFSPEWQAIRWALKHEKSVRFIDLPQSLRRPGSIADSDIEQEDQQEVERSVADDLTVDEAAPDDGKAVASRDPLDSLAHAAGFADGESWWSRLIEEYRGEEEPIALFDSIREAMAEARTSLGSAAFDPEEPAREAYMRKCIRAALKEGLGHVVVICGAWHAPSLTLEAVKASSVKADERILKRLTKRKTAATWIPWTHDRLSMSSGYGAGVRSPGWYEHLWLHGEHLSERWMTRVARLMRDEDLGASPASVIESVRLADSLAALRGRSIAGLEELEEATLAILCHGNPMPLRVIESKLIIGQRLGQVPEESPTVPLQRDLTAQQRSLRMKVTADDSVLDLDQRKPNDLARSHLLYRLKILKIEWGVLMDNQQQRTSTFHEIWKLQWHPEFAVAVMEAARWGNTVAEASAAFVTDQAARTGSLTALTVLLDDAMLADLPMGVERLISRIETLSAVAADVGHMMEAFPPLARVLRYGNVRKTDAALIEPVIASLLARICAGLLPACASLNDDAAEVMKQRIDLIQASLSTLDNEGFFDVWEQALRKVGHAEIHGLVAGRAWRHLLDTGSISPEDSATRLSLALSRGNDPGKASSWLEGFLAGSGMVLVHDSRLLDILDQWVCSLPREIFEEICPIARRTFSTFEKPERRQIGEKLRRGSTTQSTDAVVMDDYDTARGTLVEPVLRLILGDSYP